MNVSKSGIGFSTGVKGMRYSVGPRGTYVTLGAKGFTYRKKISPPAKRSRAKNVRPQISDSQPDAVDLISQNTVDAVQLTDSSSEHTVAEINRHITAFRFPIGFLVRWGSVYLACYTATLPGPIQIVPGLAILIPGLFGAAVIDGISALQKNTSHLYDMEKISPLVDSLDGALSSLSKTQRIWKVASLWKTEDYKHNAGASGIMERKTATLRLEKHAPYITTNLHGLWSIEADDLKLFFFPEQLFVFQNNQYGALPYDKLEIECSPSEFREAGDIPRDAERIGTAWLYSNKDGGPDLRHKDNPEIPILKYGTISITSDSGPILTLLTSNFNRAEEFVNAFQEFRNLEFSDVDEPKVTKGLSLAAGNQEEEQNTESDSSEEQENSEESESDDDELNAIIARVAVITVLIGCIIFGANYLINTLHSPKVDVAQKSDQSASSEPPFNRLLLAAKLGDDAAMTEAQAALLDASSKISGNLEEANRLNKLGLAELKSKKYSKAAEHFLQASKQDSSEGRWLSNLGFAEMHAGKLKSARDHLIDSIKIDASRSVAWGDLAEVYARLGEKEKAVDALIVGFHSSRGENQKYIESLAKAKDQPAAVRRAAEEALRRINSHGQDSQEDN